MRFKKGDLIQLMYRRNKDHTFQVLESPYVDRDQDFLYLETGKYRRSRIKLIRNLTEENEIVVDNYED